MRAVVFHAPGHISLDQVPDPRIQQPTDAIVRITTTAICGTDLHAVRGSMPGMVPGTILGHEGVGEVVEVGSSCRNFAPGDRVLVSSTVACGNCPYCRRAEYSQCDVANPNGPSAGTCFFGGPQGTGPVDGMQAEYVRVPFAATTLVRLPDDVSDEDGVLLTDVFPTAWFGARLAAVAPGDTVAVYGAGPVGQLAAVSARVQGAGRVLVVDGVASRLETARWHNFETVDFNREDPVEVIRDLTGGVGVDKVIDAVGIDAQAPRRGPAARTTEREAAQDAAEQQAAAPDARPDGPRWCPGDSPAQVGRWAVETVAKAGTIGVIGVYVAPFSSWPIGAAMMRNLVVRMGNAPHRRYIPELVQLARTGAVSPSDFISQHQPVEHAVSAYQSFEQREVGWLKTTLAT